MAMISGVGSEVAILCHAKFFVSSTFLSFSPRPTGPAQNKVDKPPSHVYDCCIRSPGPVWPSERAKPWGNEAHEPGDRNPPANPVLRPVLRGGRHRPARRAGNLLWLPRPQRR